LDIERQVEADGWRLDKARHLRDEQIEIAVSIDEIGDKTCAGKPVS
jgi:hypothetical protein